MLRSLSLPVPCAHVLGSLHTLVFASCLVGLPLLAGCTVEEAPPGGTATAPGGDEAEEEAGGFSGTVTADVQGSSTVFPIGLAVAEAIRVEDPNTQVTVTRVGSGPGIAALINGEADIANASRKIKDSEVAEAAEKGIEITELPVALDGIVVVVNPENDWVDAITVADLAKIWSIDSSVKTWKDVNPDWPDEEILLYGPDSESGTFEFFSEEINGEKGNHRKASEYQPADNDNAIVTGVAGNTYAMGYFGYSYLANQRDRLKGLNISATDSLDDAVTPTIETIESLEYKPLARPLYFYINNERFAKNAAAQAYVDKMVSEEGQALIADEDMVSLSPETLEQSRETVKGLVRD